MAHSLSPVLHAAAYAALGLTWWRYEAIECREAGLSALLDQCGPDWAGLSLTMPLKQAVLPLLDRTEPLVTEVGAANTVVFAAEQRLGYNTDVPGLIRALAGHGIGAGASPGPAVILGGGATACAALAALRDLGERSVTVAVRDPGRPGDLISASGRIGITVTIRPLEPGSLAGMRLVISTVPVGGSEFIARIISRMLPAPQAVLDVVYHPWPTPLAVAAAAAGITVVGGFELLLHQAGLQVELMTDRTAPIAEMRRAGEAELARRAAVGLA